MMFNVATEVLATLMRKVVNQGKIAGVMGHLIPEGITHIQYAYDTILMVEADDRSIWHIEFILYRSEWLSRLKNNYHKSEAFIFVVDETEK
jgi:hypothetical protein